MIFGEKRGLSTSPSVVGFQETHVRRNPERRLGLKRMVTGKLVPLSNPPVDQTSACLRRDPRTHRTNLLGPQSLPDPLTSHSVNLIFGKSQNFGTLGCVRHRPSPLTPSENSFKIGLRLDPTSTPVTVRLPAEKGNRTEKPDPKNSYQGTGVKYRQGSKCLAYLLTYLLPRRI